MPSRPRHPVPDSPLHVWLCHVGEYLPIDSQLQRPLRTGITAQLLLERSHRVTWWTSTFNHEEKRQRYGQDTTLRLGNAFDLRLLHAPGYRRNISVARLWNHLRVARRFAKEAPTAPPPDLILASLPTVELAAAAARHASRWHIPLVVDVRDQHPDIYLDILPRPVRPLAQVAIAPLRRQTREALQTADAITAISPSILDWALTYAARPPRTWDHVVPVGYPRIAVSDADREAAGDACRALGVDPARRIVWYVGTFNRWIDLGTAIETAKILREAGETDYQFVFSGDGDYRDRWRAQAAGLENVVFTGWVDMPKIAYLGRVAWTGLAPYRRGFNAFGNKLFEFMAAGLPILFSIEGDARRMLERHGVGIRYDAGDPGSLAAGLRRLAAEPGLRRAMADASLIRFESDFRADTVYARYIDFLTEVAREHRQTRRAVTGGEGNTASPVRVAGDSHRSGSHR